MGGGARIVIDATASEAVAAQHAHWLAAGIHVVTACKLGQGTALARWQAIQAAQRAGGTRYGDSATVGAGLPLLRSLRALREGGDRIHAIAGVLSGSLAWLFNHYDGKQPFSGFVRQARAAGYTEPDPREDLAGEDVRRKLLILARAAGFALEADAVQVRSLVPPALATLPREVLDAALPALDAPLREAYAGAYKDGAKLRFIDEMRALGCRFALDDFGTGFCSFNYLRALDVDYFKIDGSFVREMDTSPLAAEVVRSITKISHLLMKKTVAEHTETIAQRDALAALGVDFAQGYAIDRPMPLDDYFNQRQDVI